MNTKKALTKSEILTLVLTSAVCLIPIIAAVILYDRLPDQVITHWSMDGTPNGWMPKAAGVLGLPIVMFLLNLCFPFLLKADPKSANMSEALVTVIRWIIPAITLLCSVSTLASAMGIDVPVSKIIPLFIGLLFIIVGNYLPKTKQSYTMGIKLPWTLNSEENWNRTHRIAGFLWVVCGFLFIVGIFFTWPAAVYIILIAVMTLVPTYYSYLLFKKGI